MPKNLHLKFHHLEDGPNIAKGSSSLRILGEKMSAVDFLVREAIQNSSDACYRERRDGETFVCVDFDTGTFRASDFNALFDVSISNVLNRRYPGGRYEWIAISDYNCEGLNGDVHPDDPNFRSNFCRLICDSGEAQDKEGSGGCWGYGKSVYYRIGIGIVIFYSRFLDSSGEYHSRLIIKLAEDEKSPRALLREAGYAKSAGIAWWCDDVKDGWVYPIEDEEKIEAVLGIFGIKKYEDEVRETHGTAELTGTKIIVPYFEPNAILAGLLPKHEDEISLSEDQKDQVKRLVSDIPSALRNATLRWYSSRLGNSWLRKYNQNEPSIRARIPMLKVRVLGSPVNPDAYDGGCPEFFVAVQELYNRALYQAAKAYWPYKPIPPPSSSVLKAISLVDLSINNYLSPPKTKAGWLVHAIFKPSNSAAPNPFVLTNKFSSLDAGENPPMLFFMREPGMVIDYVTGDEWLKNVGGGTKNDEFVVALFYPNVKAAIRSDIGISFPKFLNKTLGFYLRSCEEAEHSTWTEPSGIRIVERIRINCANKLSRVYTRTVAPTGGESALLANYLSNRLLRAPKRKPGETTTTSAKHSSINIVSVDASTPGKVRVQYKLRLLKGDPLVRCELQLILDSGHVDYSAWTHGDSKFDGAFPVAITSFGVEKVSSGGQERVVEIDLFSGEAADGLGIPVIANSYEVEFGNGERDKDLDLQGWIEVRTEAPMYKFKFAVKSEGCHG